MLKVKVQKLDHFDNSLPLPKYETSQSAGCDIRACLENREKLCIKPGQRMLVPTGLAMQIPKGYEIQIRPRSGLSLKTDLLVVNSPGTVDADYRGEVKIILGNFGTEPFYIEHGHRIAQLVIAPVTQCFFEESATLDGTQRGTGGFGSTGVN